MFARGPVSPGAVTAGGLLVLVDWIEETTSAYVFAGSRVERRSDVIAAIDVAARSRPDVVALRVPLDEVVRTDALGRLYAAVPACRVVLLPVGPVLGAGYRRSVSGVPGPGGGASLDLITGLPSDPEVVVRRRAFRPRVESAGLARQVVRAACTDADVGELRFDALLVATELVTNAVTHARTALGLTVRAWPDAVRIEVRDRVSKRPVLRHPDVSASGGRGLAMMGTLCSAWGIDPSANGKTVWGQLVGAEHP